VWRGSLRERWFGRSCSPAPSAAAPTRRRRRRRHRRLRRRSRRCHPPATRSCPRDSRGSAPAGCSASTRCTFPSHCRGAACPCCWRCTATRTTRRTSRPARDSTPSRTVRASSSSTRRATSTDDVAFISALIDTLVARYPIDPARVFVTGHSNGAHMAYHLAHSLWNKVAAIAPVEGSELRVTLTVPPRRTSSRGIASSCATCGARSGTSSTSRLPRPPASCRRASG